MLAPTNNKKKQPNPQQQTEFNVGLPTPLARTLDRQLPKRPRDNLAKKNLSSHSAAVQTHGPWGLDNHTFRPGKLISWRSLKRQKRSEELSRQNRVSAIVGLATSISWLRQTRVRNPWSR